ncbi:hypothetical protein D9M69_546580 [compost metagenome]
MMPLSRAFLIAGTMALASLGVMRMVLAPAAIMFSIAVIWPALSPSAFPAPDSSLAPSFLASSCAPSFIFTKKGLVSVLVTRPMTGSPAARAVEAVEAARARTARAGTKRGLMNMGVSPSGARRSAPAVLAVEPDALPANKRKDIRTRRGLSSRRPTKSSQFSYRKPEGGSG